MSATTVRIVLQDVRRAGARSDIMVVAAAITCFAVFGLVPLLAIGTRVSAAVFGYDEVQRAAAALAAYLPGPLGLDHRIEGFARTAADAPWWTVVVALVPVSLYSEGIVRCLERFSRDAERRTRTLRGRLLTPVLAVLAIIAVALVVGPVRPLFGGVGTGTGPRLLGVLIAFNVLFFPTFGALLLVYRWFATTSIRHGPLALGAFVAASWLSGQLLGYTIAVRVVGGFSNAFGGFAPAAVVAAIAFLVYLEHLVFLGGYLVALVVHERAAGTSEGQSTTGGESQGRSRSAINAR